MAAANFPPTAFVQSIQHQGPALPTVSTAAGAPIGYLDLIKTAANVRRELVLTSGLWLITGQGFVDLADNTVLSNMFTVEVYKTDDGVILTSSVLSCIGSAPNATNFAAAVIQFGLFDAIIVPEGQTYRISMRAAYTGLPQVQTFLAAAPNGPTTLSAIKLSETVSANVFLP